ncbi:MAG: hypothetical protein C4322_09565 [Mastigocladus sp. ERB_26_1]
MTNFIKVQWHSFNYLNNALIKAEGRGQRAEGRNFINIIFYYQLPITNYLFRAFWCTQLMTSVLVDRLFGKDKYIKRGRDGNPREG